MSVLALVPARTGSKGVPGKNWRTLGGKTLIQHAVDCAKAAGVRHICVSTDDQSACAEDFGADVLWRGPELAADDTPMLAVVQDFLARMANLYEATLPAWTGRPVQETLNAQIILLLQPTAVFRTPTHLTAAIELLQSSGADSVVSVVELPKTHSPDMLLRLVPHDTANGSHVCLRPYLATYTWADGPMPTRRQDARTAYKRDGTVYAFKRSTVKQYGTIYGQDVRPLIIPPEKSCELDTEQDWRDVERRWRERG